VSEATFRTPWGLGRVVVEGEYLVEVVLPRLDAPPVVQGEEPPDGAMTADGGATGAAAASGSDAAVRGALPDPPDPAARWARELDDYFSCGRQGWSDEEVRLEERRFTPFRTAVYRALLEVPVGSTVTYGELARRVGRPGAARAVGTAMAQNPIAVVVPCHRVVRNDGSLGHYGFGDAWKPLLLQLEGARA